MACEHAMAVLPPAVVEQQWNERQLAQPIREPAWRLWRYRRPMVVLGCSQRRLMGAIDDASGAPILVRESGGGAVLTGPWMLGMSVALPANHPLVVGGPVDSYRWLGERVARVLREAGLAGAHAIAPERLRAAYRSRPIGTCDGVDWACFGGLSPWEVLAGDGRKIVGLAQVRRRNGVLLVGGVLLEASPWSLLCRSLACPDTDAHRLTLVTTSCRDEIGPSFDASALEHALGEALQAHLALGACLH